MLGDDDLFVFADDSSSPKDSGDSKAEAASYWADVVAKSGKPKEHLIVWVDDDRGSLTIYEQIVKNLTKDFSGKVKIATFENTQAAAKFILIKRNSAKILNLRY